MDTRAKIISLEQAVERAARWRAEGRPLVVAACCFDVLQASHARFLGQLRADGSALLVAVYDDAVLCRLRRQARPVLPEQARAQLVAALAVVDHVLIWPQPSLDGLLECLHPDRVEHVSDERNIIGEVLDRHQALDRRK